MFKIKQLNIFIVLIALFILGNTYVLLYKRDYFYMYNAIPLLFIIGYYAIYELENLLFFVSFITPLAITLKEIGIYSTLNLSLPSEPLMAGLFLLYLLNKIYTGKGIMAVNTHTLTILIAVQLFWIFITTLTSVDFIVSIKFFISRLWFVFSCYFLANYLFRNKKNIIPFLSCYIVSLAIVCFYTLYQHSKFNFDHKTADWVMSPFYNDHTAYGAALAMFIPVVISLLLMSSVTKKFKIFLTFILVLFTVSIILSYARAAWMGVFVAVAVLITLFLRFNFKVLVIGLITTTLLFFSFQDDILIALGRNNTDAEEGFMNNIESVSNISTDASNLERLNRWSCAIRMWEDKPFFGWGPGTYMFNYAPYQLSTQKTIISTNFGTNGNAHSEYLSPLCEQGILGLLIMLGLLLYVFNFGYRLFKQVKDRDTKILATGVFLGLVTYFTHGFINNFLDTDKLSLPFWSFLSIMVCIDLFHKNGIVEND